MAAETGYFARVTAGLEPIAWEEIQRLGARLEGFGHRRIDIGYSGPPAALLTLRSVDDVYARVARLAGLGHTRASLARLTDQLVQMDFAPALETVGAARALGARLSYRVTASHLGKRNYSRYDVEGAIADGLAGHVPWRFVPNAPDEDEPDLDLRVLLEDDWALIGVRLGDAPLHRRAYKVASQPGALKAPVAYCLGWLAGLAPGDTVLDLACGGGTILAEAAALVDGGALIGVDVERGALALAQANLGELGLAAHVIEPDQAPELNARAQTPMASGAPTVLLYHGDAADVPLADRTIAAVVTNLPWGRQVRVTAELTQLYSAFVRTIARVLQPSGRAVLLTDQADSLRAALAASPDLRIAAALPISLFGRHPTIYTLSRYAAAPHSVDLL